MLPDQLAKSNTEHAHQRAFFQWLNFARVHGFVKAKQICEGAPFPYSKGGAPVQPELALFHAIPNGGFRHKSEAAKLKAEGVRSGIPDTFLPVSRQFGYRINEETRTGMYHGLYIEFKDDKYKNRKNGGLSDAQVTTCDELRLQGYCVRVAYTWRNAANSVMGYYGLDASNDFEYTT